jgi:hypothetical protein
LFDGKGFALIFAVDAKDVVGFALEIEFFCVLLQLGQSGA